MTLLAGRYEALKAIASGGMGTVYLGRAVGVGGFERLVAIKLMHRHYVDEPEFVGMFLDEARLAALVRHPNVVATIDVQDGKDGLFLVMEYVEGPALKALRRPLWKRDERSPLPITLRLFIDVLAGLHAAHEQRGKDGNPLRLVHRDVSPPNILVGADGVTRLTDFGVARAETRLSSTRGGKLKGKLPYMPPEQLMGEPLDRRCDVYAAGVVLWEELTGQRLFKADSEGAMLQQILSGPERAPHEVVPDVPEALSAACMKALARQAGERWDTAADFAEALEEAAASAGLRIATARAVAAYVAEQAVHEPIDLKAIAAMAGLEPSATVTSPKQGADAPASKRDGVGGHSGVTSTEATVSATEHGPSTIRRRSRAHVTWAIAATAVVVGGVALAIVGGRLSAPGQGGPASADVLDEGSVAQAPESAPRATAEPAPASESTARAVGETSANAPGAPSASASSVAAPAAVAVPGAGPNPHPGAAPLPHGTTPPVLPSPKRSDRRYDPDKL